MFHSLIKMFHDGIILTENDDVLFYNTQIKSIYDINYGSQINNET
jgi:hypothetical protein